MASATAGHGQESAYSAFRLARLRPGDPSRPEITLPDGYVFVPGAKYDVASRAEYYTFVQGPAADGVEVHVRWPDVRVEAVVHMDDRLPIRHDPGDPWAFTFTLPVRNPTIDSLQPTLQIWSHPEVTGSFYWRIEHNDPDRAAGPWTEVAWPANQVQSQIHQLFATEAIWRDSGLLATAAAKGHRWVLMGFETNNTLHPDNPPHWHMSYNAGPDWSSPTNNPHFWIDKDGRNFYNGMDVTGHGRLRYRVGDPAPLYDFSGDANDGRGELVVTITIREDGGLDVDPPGGPRYSMTAGPAGDLVDEVAVRRADRPWLRIRTRDRVHAGLLTANLHDLQEPSRTQQIVHRYDRLTGVLTK
ncbi:hypothetical protein ACTWPT_34910 [Nonomuraea sp. 3N208]|uniref:hypothetical protein n=1 Tax=Nonomuraea sp. 3N208 TaxID=3457421 RepID=UPI003FD40798